MNILIKLTIIGKLTRTYTKDNVERISYLLNYQQDNGEIVGQLSVSEEIFNTVEAGKEYILEGNYKEGKFGNYVRVTGIYNNK